MAPARWRDFAPGIAFPATWTDGIESLIGDHLGANFRLTKLSDTVLRVPIPTGDVVTATVNGKPRWVSVGAGVDATHPGGAAGTYPVFVTAAPDSFALNGSGDEVDSTDHAFYLRVEAIGAVPDGTGTRTHFRRIGDVDWDGTKITAVRQTTAQVGIAQLAPEVLGAMPQIGDLAFTAATGDTPDGNWLQPDGRLVAIASYPAAFLAMGHAFNLGVDPGGGQMRIPDLRGRGVLVPSNLGTAAGSVTGNGRAQVSRGQSGGEVNHSLAVSEIPSHTHTFQGKSTANAGSGSSVAPMMDGTPGGVNSAFWTTDGGTGGGGAHNVLSPYQALHARIRMR